MTEVDPDFRAGDVVRVYITDGTLIEGALREVPAGTPDGHTVLAVGGHTVWTRLGVPISVADIELLRRPFHPLLQAVVDIDPLMPHGLRGAEILHRVADWLEAEDRPGAARDIREAAS